MDFSPLSSSDKEKVLRTVGATNADELFRRQIPEELWMRGEYDIPKGCSEAELRRDLAEIAAGNRVVAPGKNFLGCGIYNHFVPSVVPALWSRSEFMTAYTPYQPEVSQGVLQAIFEFQTMICELTALPVANASLYDGASATAEAVHVAVAHTGRRRVAVAGTLHPEYLQTLRTYLSPQDIEITVLEEEGGGTRAATAESADLDSAAALVVQHPNFYGCLEEVGELAELAHASGALVIAVVDPISLGLLAPPGEWGADIAVGEGQGLGIDPSFGGPGFGFFACTQKLVRLVPGRICGRTEDRQGRTGYVLTLQAREQHIRREKATSNICTNHQLTALAATIYLAVMGPRGLAEVADGSFRRAHYFTDRLERMTPWRRAFDRSFFKEVTIKAPNRTSSGADRQGSASRAVDSLAERGFLAGVPVSRFYPVRGDELIVAFTEQHTRADIDAFVDELGRVS